MLLASGSADTTVRLWERSGELRGQLDGHAAAVTCVAFSSDGKLLASSSFRSVKLWDGATGALRSSLEAHTHWINGLAFSPDGALLATGSSDGTIRLWSVASALRDDGSERCLVILVPARDGWMAITPDGRYKRHGDAAMALGFSAGLCRFDPGELDDYPGLFAHPRRVADDEPLFVLERSGDRRSV
jgi:WD40 repeat protein